METSSLPLRICLSESESSSSSTTVLTHHSEPSTSSTLSTEPPISMGQYLLGMGLYIGTPLECILLTGECLGMDLSIGTPLECIPLTGECLEKLHSLCLII